MTRLLEIAAFALGMYLSIRTIAALYGVIDFWYAIGTTYPRVIRGILGWSAITVATAWLLHPPYRVAFEAGLLAFFLFYLSLFSLRHFLLRALRRPPTATPG